MQTNFLYPHALNDVVRALLERTAVDIPNHLHAGLTEALRKEFRTNVKHTAGVNLPPTSLPDWAAGKELFHPLPEAELQGQLNRVARFVAEADGLVASKALKAENSTLHREVTAVLRSLPHESWSNLVDRVADLHPRLGLWSMAQARVWSRRLIPIGASRWRRLRSGQELWDASAGAIWCTGRTGDLSEEYVEALHRRALQMWVLESRAEALVLLRFDPIFQEIEEVKDRCNRPPLTYRREVRRLAQKLGAPLTEGVTDDIAAFAFDEHLGKRAQPYWQGVVQHRELDSPIRFRLWADGRRRKYLASFSAEPRGAFRFHLRLCAQDDVRLVGTAPPQWQGSPGRLMERALGFVESGDGRAHWSQARRCARRAA